MPPKRMAYPLIVLVGAAVLVALPCHAGKAKQPPKYAYALRPEPPVKDQTLRKRLRIVKTYRTSQVETLQSLAHLLYGHRTWWPRIKKMNPALAKLGPKSTVRKGARISYLAPKIGDEYVVQKNDWLIRIAIWKYGDTEIWRNIYEKNVRKISHPNLIRPGDRLFLGKRGGIQLVKAKQPGRKQVLLAEAKNTKPEDQPSPVPSALIVAMPSPEPSPSMDPPPSPSPGPVLAVVESGPPFDWVPILWLLLGIAVGIAVLLLWRSLSVIRYRISIWKGISERRSGSRQGERPDDEYGVDRSLIADEQVDIEQRPDYHAIRQSRWKMYKKIICQFNFFGFKRKR